MNLEPATTDQILTTLRDDQFLYTADCLRGATTYYSDSVHDEVTSALDAALALNFCDDLIALHTMILAPYTDDGESHFTDLDLSPLNSEYARQLRESRN